MVKNICAMNCQYLSKKMEVKFRKRTKMVLGLGENWKGFLDTVLKMEMVIGKQ